VNDLHTLRPSITVRPSTTVHPSTALRRPGAALVALAAVLGAALLPPAPAGAAPVVNRFVLRVNDRIATLVDYEERKRQLMEDMVRADLPLDRRRELAAQLPERVFQDLYQELLLLSRADQLNVAFTEQELDNQIARVRESYGFATEDEFTQALAQSGLTPNDFREQTRVQMRIQDVVNREVRSQIAVGEELARAWYRDHPEQFQRPQRMRLRELVVLGEGQDDSPLDTSARRALARELHAEISAGGDLAEVAAEHGERPAVSGPIDLGWVTPGDLAPELEAAAWGLDPGQITEPVESRGSLHLVEVLEREHAGLRPFNEVAEEAEARARQEVFAEAMVEYMDRLEARSYVVAEPPPEAADFRRLGGSPTTLEADAPPTAEPEPETGAEAEAGALTPAEEPAEPEALTGEAAAEAAAAEGAEAAERAPDFQPLPPDLQEPADPGAPTPLPESPPEPPPSP